MTGERIRLLALVEGGPPAPAVAGPENRYEVFSGDAQWFQDNIPCQMACPARTDVPRYIALIADGRFDESYALNSACNVLPGCLGRVCARPCEAACRRRHVDAPVAICSLKRAAADNSSAIAPAHPSPIRRTGHTVSIVGAGPSGLAAARELALAGHDVVVYDRLPLPGGMLVAGVPNWRLPRAVVAKEIAAITDLGVRLRLNTHVGRDVSFASLLAASDALLLAVGCQTSARLGIPGEDLSGVVGGLQFLEASNLGTRTLEPASGYRAVTIGGGYTSLDCARSALRTGASSSVLAYRRGPEDIPVDEHELREAADESVELRFFVSPTRIVGQGGRVTGVEFVENRVVGSDAGGKRRIKPIPDSTYVISCDLVIVAIGQTQDRDVAQSGLLTQLDTRGVPVIDQEFRTAHPRIWAAGDFVGNPRSIIAAVADGKRAAAAIDRALSGHARPAANGSPGGTLLPLAVGSPAQLRDLLAEGAAEWTALTLERRTRWEDDYRAIPRQEMPVLPPAARGLDQPASRCPEVELGFDVDIAQAEAQRCLQCQLNIFIDASGCILCGECVAACPQLCIAMVGFEQLAAIDGDPELAARIRTEYGAAMLIDEDPCIRCGRCVDRCPTGCLTMEHFSPVGSPLSVAYSG